MTREESPANGDRSTRPSDNLQLLVHPTSVAVMGASSKEGSLGYIAADNLVNHSNFNGEIVLVNRRGVDVVGRSSVRRLEDSEVDSIDVALVVVPREDVPSAVQEAQERGASYAVVMSSGFGEVKDGVGETLNRELESVIRNGTIRVMGPNCPGLGSLIRPLGLTIQPGFKDEIFPGRVGIVAQSGGMTRCLLQAGHSGVGFSHFFSPGNQLDLDVSHFVDFLIEDEATDAIALLIEHFASGNRFVAAAERARRSGKPIVMLKGGTSDAARRAAASHTGALIGSRDALAAIARRHDIALVDDVTDLVNVAAYLARYRSIQPQGVAIYGMSGGAGVVLTDALERRGIHLSTLDAECKSRLQPLLPPYVAPENPVDLAGASFFLKEGFESGLRAVTQSSGVGAVLVVFNAWYEGHTERFAQATLKLMEESELPIIPVWLSQRSEVELGLLQSAGLPVPRTADAAAAIIEALERSKSTGYSAIDDSSEQAGIRYGPEDGSNQEEQVSIEVRPGKPILEHDAKKLLAKQGLRVTREEVASSLEEATSIANSIGYPVIVKALSDEATHRANTGLVSRRISDDHNLKSEWFAVAEAIEIRLSSKDTAEVLVSEYIEGAIEAYLGVKRDPEWGPIMSMGLGGEWIEEFGDVCQVPIPATLTEVQTALLQSKLADVIRKRGLDISLVDLLSETAIGLSDLVESMPSIVEADLNPIILSRDRATVVDALIVTNGESQ